jgi:hypothetical protein
MPDYVSRREAEYESIELEYESVGDISNEVQQVYDTGLEVHQRVLNGW